MQPDGGGPGLVEEEGGHCFTNIGAQFVPSVALRENVMRQALGHKAAIRFLRPYKHYFHAGNMTLPNGNDKRSLLARPADAD